MPAPKGNQFWKLRSKHGKDRIISSPEVMIEAVYEFLELKSDEKILKPEAIKSGDMAGTQFDLKFKDYPTLPELAHFLGFMTLKSWYDYKDYSTDDNNTKGYLKVITHTQEIFASWKMKGAAIGLYNPSIVARDLGLADKSETEHTGKIEVSQIKGMTIKK